MQQRAQPSIVAVISGGGTNLPAIVDACESKTIDARVQTVISNVPNVYGLERARQAGIEAIALDHKSFSSRDAYDWALAREIDGRSPDLIVLAGFMRILTPEFVAHFRGKLINIHPSLLPRYRGLHTHKRAIEAGDTEHGATVHFVSAELDGGPPIIRGKVPVLDSDDEISLAEKVQSDVERHIYPLAIQWCLEKKVTLTDRGAELNGELLPPGGFEYSRELVGFNTVLPLRTVVPDRLLEQKTQRN